MHPHSPSVSLSASALPAAMLAHQSLLACLALLVGAAGAETASCPTITNCHYYTAECKCGQCRDGYELHENGGCAMKFDESPPLPAPVPKDDEGASGPAGEEAGCPSIASCTFYNVQCECAVCDSGYAVTSNATCQAVERPPGCDIDKCEYYLPEGNSNLCECARCASGWRVAAGKCASEATRATATQDGNDDDDDFPWWAGVVIGVVGCIVLILCVVLLMKSTAKPADAQRGDEEAVAVPLAEVPGQGPPSSNGPPQEKNMYHFPSLAVATECPQSKVPTKVPTDSSRGTAAPPHLVSMPVPIASKVASPLSTSGRRVSPYPSSPIQQPSRAAHKAAVESFKSGVSVVPTSPGHPTQFPSKSDGVMLGSPPMANRRQSEQLPPPPAVSPVQQPLSQSPASARPSHPAISG